MAKSLIAKSIALTGRERLELFVCMRLSPTKSSDERKKRKLIRNVLKIPQSNVLIKEIPGNSLLTIGRTVNKVFQREREREPDDRLFEITPDLADYLIGKLGEMTVPDEKADLISDLEEKLIAVREGRYEAPDVPEWGGEDDFVSMESAKAEKLAALRAEIESLERQIEPAAPATPPVP